MRIKLDPATLMAALALLVSVFALVVSFFEFGELRRQTRAEIWPYVELGTHFNSAGYTIDAANKGAGPARVIYAQLSIGGKVVSDALAVETATTGEDPVFSWGDIGADSFSNRVIAPGETLRAFHLPWVADKPKQSQDLAIKINAAVTLEVCYCSIFEDCWTTSLGKPAQAIEACTISDTTYQ